MTKNLAQASITCQTAPGAVTDTLANRFGIVLNVKSDFGAKGDGSTDDTTAIVNAIAAMNNTPLSHAASVYFPPGQYHVTSQIDISGALAAGAGRIFGAGRGATSIIGSVNNGFIFSQPNNTNGPGEISHLTLYNGSTNLATGALRILSGINTNLIDCQFTGNYALDLGWNSFGVNIISCGVNCINTNVTGTIGIQSNGCNIFGVRTGGNFDTFFSAFGNNGHALFNVGAEENNVAIFLGVFQGWASSCTVSGTTLTVAGTLSPLLTPSSIQANFIKNAVVYGTGLPLAAWGTLYFTSQGPAPGSTLIVRQLSSANQYDVHTDSGATISNGSGGAGNILTLSTLSGAIAGNQVFGPIGNPVALDASGNTITIVSQIDATHYTVSGNPQLWGPGVLTIGYGSQEGTYTLNNSATISTPVPMFTKYSFTCQSVNLSAYEMEGNVYGIVCANVSNCFIGAGNITGVVGEAAGPGGGEGLTAHSSIYIGSAGNSIFEGFGAGTHCYAGSVFFDPGGSINLLTFISCNPQLTGNTTLTGATISNGSGGAGTILAFTGQSGGTGIGVGMAVTGAGVAANTVISSIAAGPVYHVNNSQNVGPVTMTVVGGSDWNMNYANSAGSAWDAGAQFINCSNPPALLFAKLPGNTNCAANIVPRNDSKFVITDADANYLTYGHVAAGSGSNTGKVWYDLNTTTWRYG